MINKRIGNLEIRQASYLLPKEKWPKYPSYHIDYWYPNGYYGRESEFIHPIELGIENTDWYCYPDIPHCKIHKDCFKNPQSAMSIASFNRIDGYYQLSFIDDRPLKITKEERDIFWELIEYGYKELNKDEEE